MVIIILATLSTLGICAVCVVAVWLGEDEKRGGKTMTRKPGDYVVNAELTDEQRERFVADCVAAGARVGKLFNVENYIKWANGGAYLVGTLSKPCGGYNVTCKYASDKKHGAATQPQLMRHIADAMERDPEGWWKEFEICYNGKWMPPNDAQHTAGVAVLHPKLVRPKPRTYTLHIEGMPELEHMDAEVDPADCTFLDLHMKFSDEPTAREALEKLTRAMGNKEATWD